jgi:hypothetical protein
LYCSQNLAVGKVSCDDCGLLGKRFRAATRKTWLQKSASFGLAKFGFLIFGLGIGTAAGLGIAWLVAGKLSGVDLGWRSAPIQTGLYNKTNPFRVCAAGQTGKAIWPAEKSSIWMAVLVFRFALVLKGLQWGFLGSFFLFLGEKWIGLFGNVIWPVIIGISSWL